MLCFLQFAISPDYLRTFIGDSMHITSACFDMFIQFINGNKTFSAFTQIAFGIWADESFFFRAGPGTDQWKTMSKLTATSLDGCICAASGHGVCRRHGRHMAFGGNNFC